MWYKMIPLGEIRVSPSWKLESYRADDLKPSKASSGTVCVGDIVTARDETVDPTSPAFANLPYIGLDCVEPNSGEILEVRSASEQEIRSRSKVFRAGDVLYGRLRAYLNKVVVIDNYLGCGTCSGEFYVLIPDTARVLPQFLRWLLSSEQMVNYVKLRLSGATHPRLSLDDLLAFRVELPSLADQARAVSIIEESIATRRKLVAQLQGLPAATSSRVAAALDTARATAS